MTDHLSDEQHRQLAPAARLRFKTPIPTRDISNGEFMPNPQSPAQKRVEARMCDLADHLGGKQGLDRRTFLGSASGMAAGFLALNEVFGNVFMVSRAEAATPELAQERAQRFAGQFVFDGHTHFLRQDAGPKSPLRFFVQLRKLTGKAGWNKDLKPEEQTYADLLFRNYVKEMFLDSDTKVAIISGAPADKPENWFLTNKMMVDGRTKINNFAGAPRAMSHAIFNPGQPGWIEDIARVAEQLKPDSWKGYTVGDNLNKAATKLAWRMDDEKVAYKGYEQMRKVGIKTVCVHKGLFTRQEAAKLPRMTRHADVSDVGKAAKDFPDLNFVVYHAGFRHLGPGGPPDADKEFAQTGRLSWVSELAEIPEKYGVNNVYADLGAVFAVTCISQPKIAAAMLGILIKGLGVDKVLWGTDSLWFGSPQWQIEALRRMEIPEAMRKKHRFAPLGAADGLVKSAILGLNSARLYNLNLDVRKAQLEGDRFAQLKTDAAPIRRRRSNTAYGYVLKAG